MGAICEICGKDMKLVKGCVESEIEIGGKWYKRLKNPIHEDVDPNERCHDCGAEPGHYHHLDCAMERCPRCGGQLFSCTCKGKFVRTM